MEGLFTKILFGKPQWTCGRPTTQNVELALKFSLRKNTQIQEDAEALK